MSNDIKQKKRTYTHRLWLTVLMTVAFLLSVMPAYGAWIEKEITGNVSLSVDPVNHPESYSAVLYNNRNGLPTSEANDIVETSDGFIWIGSYSGLIRYDGNNFVRMGPSTGIAGVTCLKVDHQDRLWVGTNDSGVAMMDQGTIHWWKEEDGLLTVNVSDIEEGSDGTMYVGTPLGVCVIDEDFHAEPLADKRLSGLYIDGLSSGKDGRIYGITSRGDLFVLDKKEVSLFVSSEESALGGIRSIYPDQGNDGYVFLGTSDSRVFYGKMEKEFTPEETYDVAPLNMVMEMERIGDSIWLTSRSGIGIIDNGIFHLMADLPMNNSVSHVMQDYEGNLWFTSSRQGVMKLVPNRFTNIFEKYDLGQLVVNSTCMGDDGSLYIATDTGLIILNPDLGSLTDKVIESAHMADGQPFDAVSLTELLSNTRIRSVLRDSKNRLWFSTWHGVGLVCFDHGKVTVFNEEIGLFSNQIRAAIEAADGSFLVVNTGGLSVIRGNEVTESYGLEQGIVNTEGLTAVSAPNGDILLGSNGGGIYVIHDGKVRTISTKDGLSSGIVMRIKYDAERDVFWIVTSNSIAWMTSDYKVTTVTEFPYSNNFDLYENDKGDIWVLSSNGIYICSADDLLSGNASQPVHYSMANGLPCITTSNSYSELTEAGDLYIAGTTGVAKVNINDPLEDIAVLKMAVPYVEADGIRIWPDENNVFTIPSETGKITIYGFVFNYALTDPQVTYSLQGFDAEAVTVDRSKLAPVDYTNLPGGTYTFKMETRDAMGRGRNSLAVTIVKERAYYERPWFYIAVLIAVVAGIVAGLQLFLQRKLLVIEQRHKQEEERRRLGTELQMASEIQNGMLPHTFPAFPDRKEFDVYASMTPAKEVGGDFYDFFLIDDDHLCLTIADVSGKGIPAALFMMVSKTILKSNALLGISPSEILANVNQTICSNNPQEMFVTVWIGILELSTGIVTAANAGHEYPMILKNGESSMMKDKHGLVLGAMDGVPYQEYTFKMDPGDILYVYTDGIPEAIDPQEKMFTTDRIVEALNQKPNDTPQECMANVRSALDKFVQGEDAFDDQTMLCIVYHGKEN